MPDAKATLYGNKAHAIDAASDWDFLILTNTEYPDTLKWELPEKLCAITMHEGFRVNTLIALESEWNTNSSYELLKKKISDGKVV